jgi:peroxiredoxin
MSLRVSLSSLLVATVLLMIVITRHGQLAAGEDGDGPAVGSQAPELKLVQLSGRAQMLSQMHGTPIRLAFFCGCNRCRAAATGIAELQRAGKLGQFVSVVSLDDAAAAEFVKETGISGTTVSDPGEVGETAYQSSFCPRLWVIDRNGRIQYRSPTALEGNELDEALHAIENL